MRTSVYSIGESRDNHHQRGILAAIFFEGEEESAIIQQHSLWKNLAEIIMAPLVRIISRYTTWLGFDLAYFITNGFWVGLRQGMGIVASFAIAIAFARLSSPQTFGTYQLFFSIFAVVSVVSLPGLNNSLLQAVARGFEGDYKKIVKLSFLGSLFGIPILLGLGVYYSLYQYPALGMSFLFAAFLFPFFYAPNSWDSFLQGKGLFQVSARFGLLQTVVNCGITIGVIYYHGNNLVAILAGYLLSYVFFNILFYWRSLYYVENSATEETTVSYGLFLTKVNILSFLADNLDKIVVGMLLGPQVLAVYYLGISLVKTIFDFSKTAVAVWLPKIARTNTALVKNYLIIFVALLPLTVVLYFLLPWLIPLLFSATYQDSVALSQRAIIFLPFIFVNLFYVSHFFYNVRDKKLITFYTIILALLKIAVTIPVLMVYGIHGLAFLFGFQAVLSLLILFVLDTFFIAHLPISEEKNGNEQQPW